MRVLEGLQPAAALGFFETLCAIPHGSRDTKAISDYCVRFAQERGLSWQQDASNNVIIRKPASPGYEDHPTVILQGHLDMVCEKVADCDIDFSKDGLRVAGEQLDLAAALRADLLQNFGRAGLSLTSFQNHGIPSCSHLF